LFSHLLHTDLLTLRHVCICRKKSTWQLNDLRCGFDGWCQTCLGGFLQGRSPANAGTAGPGYGMRWVIVLDATVPGLTHFSVPLGQV
jgi:hypothetical protein